MTATADQLAERAEPMDLATAGRLLAFARACRAAARAIALYPAEHPTVATTLAHVVEAARKAAVTGELRLAVLPDDLAVGGKRMARPDSAVSELAALLHAHQIGHLTFLSDGDDDVWRRFLSLVALPPDQTRVRGGLAPLWASEGQTRIVVRPIDYSALLVDRIRGDRPTWQAIVDNCLEGGAAECDDWVVELVLELVSSPDQADRLLRTIDERLLAETGRSPLKVAGLLRAIAEYVARTAPEQLEPLLVAMAEAVTQFPLERLAPIATARRSPTRPELGAFVASLAQRMRDTSLADRVVATLRESRGSSPMLVETLIGLVPDVDRRSSIVALARHALEHGTPGGDAATGAHLLVQELVSGHDDRRFISEAYGTELAGAAARAVDLDDDTTDPPDRIKAWTDTVTDGRVRQLDAHLLVDLMELKRDVAEWRAVADLALARIQMLVLLGDFNAAAFLVEALQLQHEGHPTPGVRDAAGQLVDEMLTPELMRHVASHLDTSAAPVVLAAKRFCHAIGTSIVPRLAEVLSREERARARQHLIDILAALGPAGRQAVESLMQSPNAAVRRTAVQLLHAFGGHEALPELNAMLHDEDPNVQREATRAIVLLAIEPAYHALTYALVEGSDTARAAIASVLWTLPAEATSGLLAHIITEAPVGGPMVPIHERAMLRLGTMGGQTAVRALSQVLERRSLFAPFRTRRLHRAAVEALGRIGTPDAVVTLQAAVIGGSRSVRSAARAALAGMPAARPAASPGRSQA